MIMSNSQIKNLKEINVQNGKSFYCNSHFFSPYRKKVKYSMGELFSSKLDICDCGCKAC